MEMQKIIEKNLFFKVDFDSRYKKKNKKIVQDVKFILIGSLPVLIEYANGEKERSIINTPLIVKQDPYLRLLDGVKYKQIGKAQIEIKKRLKKDGKPVEVDYKVEAKKIFEMTVGAIKKVLDSKMFMGKKIKTIMIINLD